MTTHIITVRLTVYPYLPLNWRMSAKCAQRSSFGSPLFPITPPDGVLTGVFPDNVPRALPAGTLFGSLRRETNRAARVVTANGSELATIPTFCVSYLGQIIAPNRPRASGQTKRAARSQPCGPDRFTVPRGARPRGQRPARQAFGACAHSGWPATNKMAYGLKP